MQYYSKEVGLRIKHLRKQYNMTQSQLAEKLCYATERQLQRIENGEAICPVDRVVELAEILNTTTDYLLRGKELNHLIKTEENLYFKPINEVIVVVMKKME